MNPDTSEHENSSLGDSSLSTSEETSLTAAASGVQPLTSLTPVVDTFFVEVIKNGLVVSKKHVNKSVITFGRSRECDFALDHPSISRFHCALLWKEDPVDPGNVGFFYLMDLNSTHGTFLNKQKLDPKKLVKVIPGNNLFKLGGSSRVFMLNSCVHEREDGNESVGTEKKNIDEEASYCSWGIADDAEDEHEGDEPNDPLVSILALLQTDYTSVPTANDNVYRESPQKTIQQWYEREGYEYHYKINCINGMFKCTFELPIDGQDVVVEGKAFVKKKDSINDACLRSCQLLDKANILFPWQVQKSLKKAKYESDSEDDVMDETGDVEKKRNKMESATTINTFESLTEKWNSLSSELKSLKAKLVKMNVANYPSHRKTTDESDDALDSFMNSLETNDDHSSSTIDSKIQKSKLRMKISELEKSQKRVEKLLKLSKPNKTLEEIERRKLLVTSTSVKVNAVSKEAIKAKIDDVIKRKNIESSPIVETKTDKLPEKKILLQKPIAAFSDDEDECFKKPRETVTVKEREKPAPIIKPVKKPKTVTETYAQQESYIDWVPPATQSGDGKTSLNEKYGY